jgi:hypothetical protein
LPRRCVRTRCSARQLHGNTALNTLAALSTEPIAPLWLVGPATLVTFMIISAHLIAMIQMQMPASRRRIRMANSFLMMLSLPILAYAIAWVPPSEGRPFVLCWVALAALVIMIMVLAWLDVANNVRLARLERGALIRETATELRLVGRMQAAGASLAPATQAANDAPAAS